MNGKKMSKSDGNIIIFIEFFIGDSFYIIKGYSLMVICFFMLQSYYCFIFDFMDDVLFVVEKGYKCLMEGNKVLVEFIGVFVIMEIVLDKEINELIDGVFVEMNDDFNMLKVLVCFFELVSKINSFKGGQLSMGELSVLMLECLKEIFCVFIFDILGLMDEEGVVSGNNEVLDKVMEFILDICQDVCVNKDWGIFDKIWDVLQVAGIVVKDGKDGISWSVE